MKCFIFVAFQLLRIEFPVSAQTTLWETEGNETRLFTDGIIHLTSLRDYPLPDELDNAFEQCDIPDPETNTGLCEKERF